MPLRRRREPALRAPLSSATALFRRQEPAPRAPLLSASARGPAHQAPPPPATRRAVLRLLRLHVAPISEGFLLLHLPAVRWGVELHPRSRGFGVGLLAPQIYIYICIYINIPGQIGNRNPTNTPINHRTRNILLLIIVFKYFKIINHRITVTQKMGLHLYWVQMYSIAIVLLLFSPSENV